MTRNLFAALAMAVYLAAMVTLGLLVGGGYLLVLLGAVR